MYVAYNNYVIDSILCNQMTFPDTCSLLFSDPLSHVLTGTLFVIVSDEQINFANWLGVKMLFIFRLLRYHPGHV